MRAVFSAANLPAAPQATIEMQLEDIQGASLPSSSLSLEGTYRSPQGTFAVNVTKGPYEKTLLAGNVVLQEGQQLRLDRLRLQGRGLVWENDGPVEAVRDAQGNVRLHRLLLRSGEQEISAQGTLAPEGSVAADVRLQKVQIQPTVHAVAPTIATPDGQLALDLTLKGTLKQPHLEGNLALTALQWRQHSLGEVRAVIGLTEQILRTDLRWQDQSSEILHVHGSLGMGPAGALALQVQASGLDMQRLTPLSSAILESAGTLTLDLRLAGTLQQPQAHGHLELRDGVLRLAATGERYKDMQARLLFAGDRVDIERLYVGSRSGPLQLTGRIESTGRALRQVDLTVQAQEFTAMHTQDRQAVITAAVKAFGSLEEMSVTGNITVPRARFRLDGNLGGGPAAVEPWELTVEGVYGSGHEASSGTDGTASVPRQPAPWPFLSTNLVVDIPRNAWVQGPGTAVEMRGNLQVTKDFQAPFIVSGSIETVRGFASFYGKKFILQNGRVTFSGTEEINPVLDVTTTHEVSDHVVSIHVEGKAKQPELMLSSQPELEQADIVSLLVFGKITDRLTSSEQSALSSQTQAIAGSVAARELEKTVGKTVGLDTIEVKPGEELGTGNVGVGRYITQDIFLSYERKFDKRGGNKVGVEYSINRKLKLKASSSDYGESSLDLFWQLDY
jgi:translocation and assembly module TamB